MNDESILIDTNALADFFIGEEELREHAVRLRRRFPNWTTLPLCRHEFGNVLRTYTRLGRISAEDGIAMLRQGLAMVTFCAECDDEVVLAEANASNLTFYDAAYAARARTLGVKLCTRDGDILRNCPEIAVPIAQT
jgi:predicted nucleic acid-binding protein